MNIDIGKIIIVGQILNLGQFKVSVQGHLRVNLCQEWPEDHATFEIFLIAWLEPNIFSFVLSDRSQEKSKFNRTKKHRLSCIEMPVTFERKTMETKFKKHIILDILMINSTIVCIYLRFINFLCDITTITRPACQTFCTLAFPDPKLTESNAENTETALKQTKNRPGQMCVLSSFWLKSS